MTAHDHADLSAEELSALVDAEEVVVVVLKDGVALISAVTSDGTTRPAKKLLRLALEAM